MGNQQVLTALGITAESVMALYGIARLLRARELGPAQLAPAVIAYRADATSLGVHLREAFDLLRLATRGSVGLTRALGWLEPEAMSVASSVGRAFGPTAEPHKLGARERLMLEREAERLGGKLETVRAQLELLCSALVCQTVSLTFGDVADGRWASRPTFVHQKVAVHWDLREDRVFQGDPRILWALLEATFRSLSADGEREIVVRARADERGAPRAQVYRLAGGASGGNVLEIDLGVALAAELEVSGAIAEHVCIGLEVEPGARPTVTIAP